MIPRSKEAIKDMAISGAFVALAVLVPGQPILSSDSLREIALGAGLGWLIKSIIDHLKGVKSEA